MNLSGIEGQTRADMDFNGVIDLGIGASDPLYTSSPSTTRPATWRT